jgi:hypothetical protein
VFGTLPPLFVFSPTFLFLLKIINHIKSTITLFCQINLPEVFHVSIELYVNINLCFVLLSVYCLMYVSLPLNIQGFVSRELLQIPRIEQKEGWEMGVGVCARVLHVANWWKLLICNSLQDFQPLWYSSQVTPRGSMSSEGETFQVSVLLYRCSKAPFCGVCLGCCTAKIGSSGGTYELPCISCNAKCTVLVCLMPTTFACSD